MSNGRRGAPKGNTNAASAKRWQKALERALARSGGSVEKGLDPIADNLVAAAIGGDKDAISEIGNRLDGRSVQQIEANITQTNRVEDLSDGELVDIARNGGAGIADSESGETQSPEIH